MHWNPLYGVQSVRAAHSHRRAKWVSLSRLHQLYHVCKAGLTTRRCVRVSVPQTLPSKLLWQGAAMPTGHSGGSLRSDGVAYVVLLGWTGEPSSKCAPEPGPGRAPHLASPPNVKACWLSCGACLPRQPCSWGVASLLLEAVGSSGKLRSDDPQNLPGTVAAAAQRRRQDAPGGGGTVQLPTPALPGARWLTPPQTCNASAADRPDALSLLPARGSCAAGWAHVVACDASGGCWTHAPRSVRGQARCVPRCCAVQLLA